MKTRTIVVAASLLAVLAGGGWMGRSWLFPPALPDGILEGNGRIEGTEVAVSSKISGRILKLAVAEGDQLRQGDLIALLDAEELQQRLAQGEARVAAAQSRATLSEDEARSQLSEASARLRAAEERLNQVQARIEVLAHHAEKARLDHRRDRDLFGKGFISERQLSNSENALKLAEGELRDANAALAATRAEADAARAQRDGLAQKTPALLDTFRKEAAAAEAARDELKVMLGDAKVTAPVDGTVVTRAREPGELVQPGQPLVVLVD
ncbi:MAG TPA: biotin/lipoyl-binding protein, partial [Burkholderiales bacterium]|nr:biotin/lipoyl-binding protein [Burkholderiales bacterium]